MIKITGVSVTHSPRTIVTGKTLDYNNHCKLQFGEYVQTHEITNNLTKQERTVGDLALRLTGNTQGGFKFYSLKTGEILTCNRCTPMPMPSEAMDRIKHLARQDPDSITFHDRNGDILEDDDNDNDANYEPNE